MDIYQIRNKTEVLSFYQHSEGVTINYSFDECSNSLTTNKESLLSELIAIGSIDDESTIGGLDSYQVSQWDALNIAIRFEQTRAMDKEIDNSDIGKAIKKITDGQRDAY